ncbi:MAG: hypothetical protein J7J31_00455 [Helicobacteraceae bacterium]|nr:hypothetical protein [Helicobacteraceae bacterium]
MTLGFKIKNFFFNAFREIFVHHHGSLEFRAKIFTLLIAADENISDEYYDCIKDIGMQIYQGDEERTNLLIMTTKELVKKIKDENNLNYDTLIPHLQKELKLIPRYAKKIDIALLKPILSITKDKDTHSYQENILEFLQRTKEETLHTKQHQIELEEENLNSKYKT